MFLLEHEAKGLLARFGVPVPRGGVVDDPAAALPVPPPLVVKAQLPAGGRGKAGGVRLAATEGEARHHLAALLGTTLLGQRVRRVRVEEAVPVRREWYLALLLDRGFRGPVLLAGAHGGVDVEAAGEGTVLRQPVYACLGLQPFMVRRAAAHLGLPPALREAFGAVLEGLWGCFAGYECELVEVNPLAAADGDRLLALDAKVVLDDRALARHPEVAVPPPEAEPLAAAAARLAVYPVRMAGDIAVAAAGAGSLMATLDYVRALGGTLAGGIDLGGVVGHHPAELTEALALTRWFAPQAFLFNFYVRTWQGDVLARAVLDAVGDLHPRCPVVVRLAGHRAPEGHAILRGAGVPVTDSLLEACRWVVEATGRPPAAPGGPPVG